MTQVLTTSYHCRYLPGRGRTSEIVHLGGQWVRAHASCSILRLSLKSPSSFPPRIFPSCALFPSPPLGSPPARSASIRRGRAKTASRKQTPPPGHAPRLSRQPDQPDQPDQLDLADSSLDGAIVGLLLTLPCRLPSYPRPLQGCPAFLFCFSSLPIAGSSLSAAPPASKSQLPVSRRAPPVCSTSAPRCCPNDFCVSSRARQPSGRRRQTLPWTTFRRPRAVSSFRLCIFLFHLFSRLKHPHPPRSP